MPKHNAMTSLLYLVLAHIRPHHYTANPTQLQAQALSYLEFDFKGLLSRPQHCSFNRTAVDLGLRAVRRLEYSGFSTFDFKDRSQLTCSLWTFAAEITQFPLPAFFARPIASHTHPHGIVVCKTQ